jgi:hypothetical protein
LYELAVTAPLLAITPDKEDATDVAVYNEPPIPTPPVTTNAPEEMEVEVCELVIFVVPPMKAFPVIPSPP